MASLRIATRYAEALMTAAKEQKVLDRVVRDVEILEQLIRESREFAMFLRNSVITREKKRSVLAEIVDKTFHPFTAGFLRLLAEKGREEILPEICTQFFVLHDVVLGVVRIAITSATDLSVDQQKAIQKKFEVITRKNVRLSVSVEKGLKGGFLARLGDTVFDGSVKRQLEMLRERFAEGVGVN